MSDPIIGVGWFVSEMIANLRQNSHKRGWEDLEPEKGLELLLGEVVELERAVEDWDESKEQAEAVISEAADIAIYCMIVAWSAAKKRDPSE